MAIQVERTGEWLCVEASQTTYRPHYHCVNLTPKAPGEYRGLCAKDRVTILCKSSGAARMLAQAILDAAYSDDFILNR